MSTLQVGLAIFGGLVLAGVVAYNAWVTRRNLPRTAGDPAVTGNSVSPASVFPPAAPGADEHMPSTSW